jgi:hypothetical protein
MYNHQAIRHRADSFWVYLTVPSEANSTQDCTLRLLREVLDGAGAVGLRVDVASRLPGAALYRALHVEGVVDLVYFIGTLAEEDDWGAECALEG